MLLKLGKLRLLDHAEVIPLQVMIGDVRRIGDAGFDGFGLSGDPFAFHSQILKRNSNSSIDHLK